MKKIVCLFVVVCIIIGSVFAATNPLWNDEIKIKARVGEISVSDAADNAASQGTSLYKIYAGPNTLDAVVDGEYDTQRDVSEEDALVYFRVYQTQKVKTQELVHIALAAGPMYLNGLTSGTVADKTATDAPVVDNIMGNTSAGLVEIAKSGIVSNGFTFDVNYKDKTQTTPARDIGTFSALWTHVTDLINGDYVASVTLILTTEN